MKKKTELTNIRYYMKLAGIDNLYDRIEKNIMKLEKITWWPKTANYNCKRIISRSRNIDF